MIKLDVNFIRASAYLNRNKYNFEANLKGKSNIKYKNAYKIHINYFKYNGDIIAKFSRFDLPTNRMTIEISNQENYIDITNTPDCLYLIKENNKFKFISIDNNSFVVEWKFGAKGIQYNKMLYMALDNAVKIYFDKFLSNQQVFTDKKGLRYYSYDIFKFNTIRLYQHILYGHIIKKHPEITFKLLNYLFYNIVEVYECDGTYYLISTYNDEDYRIVVEKNIVLTAYKIKLNYEKEHYYKRNLYSI